MFYGNVLKVWNKIEMKTMECFNDLYLKCDDLSLPDVFGKFRNNSLRNHGPSHYFSVPVLSWDVMLNMTKTELELITDRDVNSLHGCEISKFLPTTAFKWINSKEFDLNKYTSISSKVCVLEIPIQRQPDNEI